MLPINQIICGDSLKILKSFPDKCIDCVVTSPPYFCNMAYNEGATKYSGKEVVNEWKKYLQFVYEILNECCRVLVPYGNAYINIDNAHTSSAKKAFGRNINLHTAESLVVKLLENNSNIDYKGYYLWSKHRAHHSSSGAKKMLGSMGNYLGGSIPIYDMTEKILWFKKQGKRKFLSPEIKEKSRLTMEEFNILGMQLWNVQAERNRKLHPAPFPEEIPHRCLKLGSFYDDLILDPFNGSGTTCLVAKKLGRRYIGIDLCKEYCDVGEQRIKEYECQSVCEGQN